jgi:HK97 gp10 family phage protein
MTIRSKLTTKGFDDYLERLAQAGQDIDAIVDEALNAGGQVFIEGMERRAPELTGKLKGHIKMTEPAQAGNYHFVKIGVYDVDRDTEMYFFYQEMGSAQNPAHPYIRPAFDEDTRAARAAMLNVFKARMVL